MSANPTGLAGQRIAVLGGRAALMSARASSLLAFGMQTGVRRLCQGDSAVWLDPRGTEYTEGDNNRHESFKGRVPYLGVCMQLLGQGSG